MFGPVTWQTLARKLKDPGRKKLGLGILSATGVLSYYNSWQKEICLSMLFSVHGGIYGLLPFRPAIVWPFVKWFFFSRKKRMAWPKSNFLFFIFLS